MKKCFIALAAIVLLATATQAQEKKPQFAWTKKMMNEVGLSSDQQTKVDSIKSASNAEMQVVRADAAMPEDAKKTKLQEMQKKRLVSIDAVLTNEQRKKEEEIKAKLKADEAK